MNDAGRRAAELGANLDGVRRRMRAAASDAGRSVQDLTLVVVTKTRPADDVRLLAGLGVGDVGESRDQEARAKVEQCQDLQLVWHFVGRLQTNKAASVAGYAQLVHSVDRARLVAALDRGAEQAGRRVTCLLQVDLDPVPDDARGGAPPAELPPLADAVARSPSLVLGGVMAVAPRAQDPRPAFERLAQVSATLRRDHPGAAIISAGMSGDLEHAVACGATHLRVGTAVLGSRSPLR